MVGRGPTRGEGRLARKLLGAAKPQPVREHQPPDRGALFEAAVCPQALPAAPSPRLIPPQQPGPLAEPRADAGGAQVPFAVRSVQGAPALLLGWTRPVAC